ncbi:Protein S-acyltransferase 10, partial [Mucuna pruriens]
MGLSVASPISCNVEHGRALTAMWSSLHEQSIVMIVISAFFSLIIIVFGLVTALARVITVDFGKWYLCEETSLCLWTGILYISYLKAHITRVWWHDAILILLLITLSICLVFLLLLLLFHSYLILTNQTTFELVRRRRIPYLRAIPERVHPFSKGVCRNLYNFCCARSSKYSFEPLPTSQEIEEKSRPYTCSDAVTCRCC